MAFFTTYTGRRISYIDPDPALLDIEEIAHHLSIINRHAGGTHVPLPLAQHCCCVAEILPQPFKLHGLLHDAHEFMTNDIPTPLKSLLGRAIEDIEHRIDRAVWRAFGVTPTEESYRAVAAADDMILAIERRDLTPCGYASVDYGLRPLPQPDARRSIEALNWRTAKNQFLDLFASLA